jgi:chemotaxis protein MotD
MADADEPAIDLPPPLRVAAAVARSREDGRGPSASLLAAMSPPPTSQANRAPSPDPVAAVAVPDVAAARRDAQAGVVPPQPPVQQIADRIVGELTAGSPLVRAQPPTPANAPQATTLKVLHFQLQPPDLGPITVRMSLKADSLDLRLEVGRHETVRLIQRDQESLSGLLRSAGYLIEAVAVRIADPVTAAMPTGTPVLLQSPAQAEGGGSPADGRSAGAQGQEQRGSHAYSPNRNDTDEIRRTTRPDGDIYV